MIWVWVLCSAQQYKQWPSLFMNFRGKGSLEILSLSLVRSQFDVHNNWVRETVSVGCQFTSSRFIRGSCERLAGFNRDVDPVDLHTIAYKIQNYHTMQSTHVWYRPAWEDKSASTVAYFDVDLVSTQDHILRGISGMGTVLALTVEIVAGLWIL